MNEIEGEKNLRKRAQKLSPELSFCFAFLWSVGAKKKSGGGERRSDETQRGLSAPQNTPEIIN
jgi:hypothetical protein